MSITFQKIASKYQTSILARVRSPAMDFLVQLQPFNSMQLLTAKLVKRITLENTHQGPILSTIILGKLSIFGNKLGCFEKSQNLRVFYSFII